MLCHAAAPPVGGFAPGMKTNAPLTLERFARFAFCFLGGTHGMCVRAAGVRAVEKEQRLERGGYIGHQKTHSGRKTLPVAPVMYHRATLEIFA